MEIIIVIITVYTSHLITGISWEAVNSELPTYPNNTITALSISGNNIYAGINNNVYKSTNNGKSLG